MRNRDRPSSNPGYRNPPKEHQFKKGQSGNPAGRPKNTSMDALVYKEMNAKITVTEDGRKKKISKKDVIAKTIVNNAIKGIPKALNIALESDGRVEAQRIRLEKSREAAKKAAKQEQLNLENLSREEQIELRRLLIKCSSPGKNPGPSDLDPR